MPSVSKAQQKLFGLVHAIQTGRVNPKKFSKSARRLASTMSKNDVTKYATTPIKHLPSKIAELLKQDINAGIQYGSDTDTDTQPFGQTEDTHETIAVTAGGPVTDFPPATTTQPYVTNDPHRVDFPSKEYEEYTPKETNIFAIVKDKKPAVVDGSMVDVYTATLLTKIIRALSYKNKQKFLNLPTEKMVATAYKLVTR